MYPISVKSFTSTEIKGTEIQSSDYYYFYKLVFPRQSDNLKGEKFRGSPLDTLCLEQYLILSLHSVNSGPNHRDYEAVKLIISLYGKGNPGSDR